MSAPRRALAGLVAFAAVLVTLQGLLLGECLQDDAFITLRYARNLADGIGLVFNPGERVEGYTNFSWTVLHAIPFAVGLGPTWFMRVAGLASGVAAVLAAAALGRELYPGRPAAPALAALFAGALPFLAAEAVMGLETAAFAALVAFGLALYLGERRAGAGRGAASGLLFAGAALTRPEGLMVAGLCGLADLVGLRGGGAPAARAFVRRWSTFALPVGAHLAFRVAYYGDVVPNTFHAKVGGGLAAAARGGAYAGEFALAALPLVVAGAAGMLLVLRERGCGTAARVVPLIALAYTAYVVLVGGDYKPSFRFFAVPALLLASLASGAVLRAGRRPLAAAGIALVIAGWTLAMGGDARTFARWRAEELTVHRAAGRWLAGAASPGSWLATGNAGVIPYYSRLPTIDMYGLTDRTIAARDVDAMGVGPAGHEKGDGRYVLNRQPRYILFQFARFAPRPLTLEDFVDLRMSLGEREIWQDARFHEAYALRSERLPGFYFSYFERRPEP